MMAIGCAPAEAFTLRPVFPFGTWLLVNIDARIMARAIAFIVLVFVLLLMTGWRYRGTKRLGITLAVGGISGVLIAATSMGNPPVIVYFLSGPDTAATNRANFTGYFAATLATLIVMMMDCCVEPGEEVFP
jgi:uncharacterized protein